jgi:hypothetical protein
MQAYQKCGLPQAPGMEISYVVKDARMREVDPERTASEFDPCYVIEHDPLIYENAQGMVEYVSQGFHDAAKEATGPALLTWNRHFSGGYDQKCRAESYDGAHFEAYPRTQELSHRIFVAETLMQVLHNQTQQAKHNPTEDYRKSHIEGTYGRRFLPAELLGQSENRGQAGDV